MNNEIFECIYEETLKVHESAANEINDKLKFLAECLERFAKIQCEKAYIETKSLSVLLKYHSRSRTFWVFDMPEIESRDSYIEYLFDLLNEFKMA